jgi:hypothetical protein
MYKYMEFYLKNWVQLSCDFGKVVPSGTTQGYFHMDVEFGNTNLFPFASYFKVQIFVIINLSIFFSQPKMTYWIHNVGWTNDDQG